MHLSSDAEDVVADWEKYKELAIQINYLKEADLSFFNGELKQLQDFIIALKTHCQKNYKPIQLRLV